MFGLIFGLSSAVGPLMGGAFTETATWRWCFYMNLPIGGVAFACLFCFLSSPKKPEQQVSLREQIMRLDPLGTLFFIPSMVCLVLALQWGGSTYEWKSWRIIVLWVVFGLTAIVFGIIQVKMPKTASLPVKVITQRTMLAGAGYMVLFAGAMFLCIYYLPLWCMSSPDSSFSVAIRPLTVF
jgi:MFS family permease